MYFYSIDVFIMPPVVMVAFFVKSNVIILIFRKPLSMIKSLLFTVCIFFALLSMYILFFVKLQIIG